MGWDYFKLIGALAGVAALTMHIPMAVRKCVAVRRMRRTEHVTRTRPKPEAIADGVRTALTYPRGQSDD